MCFPLDLDLLNPFKILLALGMFSLICPGIQLASQTYAVIAFSLHYLLQIDVSNDRKKTTPEEV